MFREVNRPSVVSLCDPVWTRVPSALGWQPTWMTAGRVRSCRARNQVGVYVKNVFDHLCTVAVSGLCIVSARWQATRCQFRAKLAQRLYSVQNTVEWLVVTCLWTISRIKCE